MSFLDSWVYDGEPLDGYFERVLGKPPATKKPFSVDELNEYMLSKIASFNPEASARLRKGVPGVKLKWDEREGFDGHLAVEFIVGILSFPEVEYWKGVFGQYGELIKKEKRDGQALFKL